MAAPQSESTLYSFTGGADGGSPDGALVQDTAGSLYGTATYGGTAASAGVIFKLSPGAQGAPWTQNVLYSFTGADDGGLPAAALTFGPGSALYGSAQVSNGKHAGVIFQLGMGSGKPVYKAIYSFTGGRDGGNPVCNVVFDKSGNLYGTTALGGDTGNGTVFILKPPTTQGGAWTETVLHSFTGGSEGANPYSGVILDSTGAIYGTTVKGGSGSAGTVYKLSPPATAGNPWTLQTLYAFTGAADGAQPYGGLTSTTAGALYGTTFFGGIGNGVVYKLSPPSISGAWTQTVIHTFKGPDGAYPNAALVFDPTTGNLYGTSAGNKSDGNVFRLLPPTTQGAGWTQQVLYTFLGSADGEGPLGSVSFDSAGNIYGTTYYAGASGNGTVFKITSTTP